MQVSAAVMKCKFPVDMALLINQELQLIKSHWNSAADFLTRLSRLSCIVVEIVVITYRAKLKSKEFPMNFKFWSVTNNSCVLPNVLKWYLVFFMWIVFIP